MKKTLILSVLLCAVAYYGFCQMVNPYQNAMTNVSFVPNATSPDSIKLIAATNGYYSHMAMPIPSNSEFVVTYPLSIYLNTGNGVVSNLTLTNQPQVRTVRFSANGNNLFSQADFYYGLSGNTNIPYVIRATAAGCPQGPGAGQMFPSGQIAIYTSPGAVVTAERLVSGSWQTVSLSSASNATISLYYSTANRPAGSYRANISLGGVTVTLPFFIRQIPPIVLTGTNNVTTTDEHCQGACDGSITINGVTNSFSQLSIVWRDLNNNFNFPHGNTTVQTTENPPFNYSTTISNLCPGDIASIVITDTFGCTRQFPNADFPDPHPHSFNPVVEYHTDASQINTPHFASAYPQAINSTCNCNGSITVLAQGGESSHYLYTLTDINGALQPGSPSPVLNGSTPYTFPGLCPGTYIVEAIDSGCLVRDTVVITGGAPLIVTGVFTAPSSSQLCNGSADITVIGGVQPYSYLWDNAATTEDVNNLCSGTHCVIVTDSVGCKDTLCFTLSVSDSTDSCTTVQVCCDGVPNTVPYWIGNAELMCNSPIRVHNNLQTVGIGYSSNNWTANYNTAGMAVLQLGGTMNATGTVALDINGVVRGIGYIATSDARFKTNVRSITNASETIKRLRGVSYGWINNEETKRLDNAAQLGFIAQEVEPIVPPAVYKDDKGVYGLNYNTFIPLLVEAFKELDAKVTALQTENQELKAEVNRLCAEGCGAFNGATSIQNGMGSYLFQNEPNPTLDNTVIRYYVHNFTVKACIVVATLDGKPVMDIPVTKGQGNISVNTKNLGQGTYLYTLMIDGRIVDSKAMVIAK